MSLLYQPDTDEGDFFLTPDYDALIDEWALLYPDQTHGPGFTVAECQHFTFHWPTSPKKKTKT